VLGFAAALACLLALLWGAALGVARSDLTRAAVAPSVRLPHRLLAGLGGAAVPGAQRGISGGRRAASRRAVAVAERKLVAAAQPDPAGSQGVSPPAEPQPSAPDRAPGAESKPPPDPGIVPPPPPDPESPPPVEPVPVPPAEPPAPPVVEPPPPPPPPPVEEPPPPPVEPPVLAADFEEGLQGWSTAGAGDVVPKVATDIVREGDKSSAVRLVGEQDRSELILGGNGSASTAGTIQFHEGDEYFYGFSFYIETMVYGEPGAHNLIMQFKSSDSGSPNFGLQLWDYAGDPGQTGGRGLWSHGEAMGGDRFLAPVAEQTWHDLVIHFKASSVGAGFYEVYLDGQLIDARQGVSMIVPGAEYAYIKDGLYRNGEEIPGTSEIRLDAAKLGETMESVQP
jgi:outer membrane biosynthesis protein TonB